MSVLVKRSLPLLVVLICGVHSAQAVELVNSHGFENVSPNFNVPGDLDGQAVSAISGAMEWAATTGAVSTAVVQNSFFAPGGGSQAVQFDYSPNTNDRFGVLVAENDPVIDADCLVTISWEMMIPTWTMPAPFSGVGPVFAVEAFDDFTNPGTPALLGMMGVDAFTREVLFQNPTLSNTTPAKTVTFGTWHEFEVQLDFSTKKYSGKFDGEEVVTDQDFVDSGALATFSDVTIAGLTSSSAGTVSGVAYFDNLVVTKTAVPEPSAFAFLGVCAIIGIVVKKLRQR